MEFECGICHKKFELKTSLEQHMNHKHGHHVPSADAPRKKLKMKNLIIAAIIIVVIGIVTSMYFLLRTDISAELNKPISATLYGNLTGVSYSTLSAVGKGDASGLRHVYGGSLTSDGKPTILYIGADYCPYCASERWAIVVALSKFGNFSNLNYMLSSGTDVFPSTPTLSFKDAIYTSPYISFQSVELQDRSGNPLQTPTSDQQKIFNLYNPQGGIPFLDINNQYVLSGTQVLPDKLSGMNWEKIGTGINNPNSNVAKGVDGAANIITTAICKATNQTPSDVCSQSFANLQIG